MSRDGIYRKSDRVLRRKYRPESIVSTYGYDAKLSEGALVPPVFLSSTFAFPSAEEAERSFKLAYHLGKGRKGTRPCLIYSRLNNPDIEILEDRLTLFEKGAEHCAVFSSGMAAIATSILSLVASGETVVHTTPVYGGTDYLFTHVLPHLGIKTVPYPAGSSGEKLAQVLQRARLAGERPALVFIETPANPTCTLTDIQEAKRAVDAFGASVKRKVYLAVDNTFLGPLWQSPAEHGADLVLYSATKFIGGHSDVVAGAALGSQKLIEDHVKIYRTMLGPILSPFDGYLLLRSLDTLRLRMTAEMINASRVAGYLVRHPKVASVSYPGLLKKGDPQKSILDRQCSGAGSMISFHMKGGKKEAFRFLNSLKLVKLAVSLGSTKTLAEHPATMTHSDLDPQERLQLEINDSLIRISVGTEHYKDIIQDLGEALAQV